MLNFVASLIIAAPLTVVMVIAFGVLFNYFQDESSERLAGRLSTTAVLLSFFSVVGLLVFSWLQPGQLPTSLNLLDWFHSGQLSIKIVLSLDTLALSIGSLFALLLFVTQRFSINYLHREKGYFRFFMVLNIYTAAMLLIVLSGNAITAFLGWELAGLSSYLLIAYAYDRPTATANATRVFITNRLGDVGFLMAIVLSFYWASGSDWGSMNEELVALDASQRFSVLGGFILAALVKSALFPFCSWITRALEGPTPSSAIFYSALTAHVGIFLLLRIAPVIDTSHAMQIILIMLGVMTIIYGWLGGLVQTDLKTALIFSSLTQTGLMLTCIGFGWYALVTFHLAAHASWRIYQMLSAPAYLTLVNRKPRPVSRWLQKQRYLFNAALQRMWLDNIIDWIAVKPTTLLAQDLNHFDERVVNRMVGLPGQIDAISSLTDYEERKRGLVNPEVSVIAGRGVMGALMEKIANVLYWFEESLVLKGSGDGLINVIQTLGAYLIRIDYLFSRPRYLWLIILLTLMVVS
ncbi:MAG: proton-conducting transporter membrane subunit [Gammaproteobacteria bacterium]|nr:proton-conducting transporter membrane subunit [Gammaproteobacteria bacterium]